MRNDVDMVVASDFQGREFQSRQSLAEGGSILPGKLTEHTLHCFLAHWLGLCIYCMLQSAAIETTRKVFAKFEKLN